MNMSGNDHIQEIILRYLSDESTAEEARELRQWISESKANEDEFIAIKNLWTISADAAMIPVDIDKAWESVSAKISNNYTPVVTLFPWKKALTIAASVILIAGIYYYYLLPSGNTWEITLAEHNNKLLQLTDGTIISMRKGSKISIPANYGSAAREVKLEGEAFFDIKHDEQHPFSIITPRSIIKDIGTSVLVQNSDSIDRVTVLEGEISFAGKKENNLQVLLKTGESAVLKNEAPQKEKVDTTNLLSWKSGNLIFYNTALAQVARDLGDYYQTDVVIEEGLGSIPITAEFKKEPLEQVITELHLLTGLKVEMKGKIIFFSK